MTRIASTESLPVVGLSERLAALDLVALHAEFEANEEFVAILDFLPSDELSLLLAALPLLEPRVHRNFIPGHKKGGSLSRYELDSHAPAFAAFNISSPLCTRPDQSYSGATIFRRGKAGKT